MFSKGKSAVKGDPTKSRSGIEGKRGDIQGEVGLKISLVWVH